MMFSEYTLTVFDALREIVNRIIAFIPGLVGALVILIVGWIVASLVGLAIERILRGAGLQKLFEKAKIEEVIKKTDTRRDTSGLIGSAVKWILMLVALIAATDVLGIPQVSMFFDSILGYVPSVVAAAAIIIIGAIFAQFVASVVRNSVSAAKLPFAEIASAVAKYAILVFSFMAALYQLGIAPALIQTLFTGLVAMLAIAGGLAFGLGGQGAAKELVETVKKEIERR